MGYTTHVQGEFRFEPPLSWAEIKDSPFNDESRRTPLQAKEVRLIVDTEEVDTEHGILTRKTASRLVLAWEDEYKEHNLVGHVNEAIDAFPGHTVTGRMDCEGEDNSDIWRIVIRDRRAVRVNAQIVWPEGSE